jgi:NADPH:quinone reductase-like Zn-dependent oxidoreductase
VVDQDKVVAIPDGVSFNEGAAAMLQGCDAN